MGQRADARRNRARLLDAARAALAGSGPVSLHAIARAAGVGQGTLYRHFPSREALLLAVYREDTQDLAEAADELLATHPPVEALARWLQRLADYGRVKHGLAAALEAATRAQVAEEHLGPVTAAITRLLRAGRATGDIRTDVDAETLLLLAGFLWRTDVPAARVPRLLGVLLDGLRTRAPSDLPDPPGPPHAR